ncbi:MAG: 2-phosphosulfolactate phosphatase [Flavobacteriales bacterium]|nr:2-phosphosulfolactate phosphatase [Flavobacteriales bacterium]
MEVCFVPTQYPLYAPDMGIVVVIDVLRATSAMVAAFEHGVDTTSPLPSATAKWWKAFSTAIRRSRTWGRTSAGRPS